MDSVQPFYGHPGRGVRRTFDDYLLAGLRVALLASHY